MASKTFIFLAFFAACVSVILSIPQIQVPQPINEQPPEPVDTFTDESGRQNEIVLSPRTLNQLLNLSAYLAGAPNTTGGLTFIPIITLLSSKG